MHSLLPPRVQFDTFETDGPIPGEIYRPFVEEDTEHLESVFADEFEVPVSDQRVR